jgi:hypothetical protein
MPSPGGDQPDRFPWPVQLPVKDFRHFCDAGAAQHFRNDRDDHLSRYFQALFKTRIEPFRNVPVYVPGGSDHKCPGRLSIEAFHCHANQFTGDIDAAPEEREL